MATILLVDDDPLSADLLGAMLMPDAHQLDWLADPRAALGHLARARPDLVIIDSVMPGLSGVHLVAQIRADPALCDLPVLMLSARRSPADRHIALRSGADDFLSKPADPDQLAVRLDALLRRRRASPGPATAAA